MTSAGNSLPLRWMEKGKKAKPGGPIDEVPMDHVDMTSSKDQLKLIGLEGQRQIFHANKAGTEAQQEPDTNQNSRKRRLSVSNTPGDIMAKDYKFPATHAKVLSSQSKHTGEIPSRAAERVHLQLSSDTNPIQQVSHPKLSHGNDHRELFRSNPASTPQGAKIILSKGYQLVQQLLRREQTARPSVALTIPLRIYLVQISELPSADIVTPHWSKPQVVRTNENPYGLWQRRRARRVSRWKFDDLVARYQEYIDELDPSTQGNERTRRILGDRIRAFQIELRQTNIEVSITEILPWLELVGRPDRIGLK
ncbi:MAG: hypothetical protein Q9204_008262 [Flavoplaca sp. TL-2023a]